MKYREDEGYHEDMRTPHGHHGQSPFGPPPSMPPPPAEHQACHAPEHRAVLEDRWSAGPPGPFVRTHSPGQGPPAAQRGLPKAARQDVRPRGYGQRDGPREGDLPDYPPPSPPHAHVGMPSTGASSAPHAHVGLPSTGASSAGAWQDPARGTHAASWDRGPAVTPSPSFAPRGPPKIALRPMSEDFENSGWKEKKLWAPSPAENSRAAPSRSNGAADSLHAGPPGPCTEGSTSSSGPGGGERAAAPGSGNELPAAERLPITESLEEEEASGSGGSEPSRPPKVPKAVMPSKSAREASEAVDPGSSADDDDSDSDGDSPPPEYAVLDMLVPRTALVINVSHVLKRLNGCCSLNQLTKTIKSFKEKTGVSLEAFLRANPATFKLEGRIVYLVDRDGEKWKPPPKVEDGPERPEKGGKARGKAEVAARGGDSVSKGSSGKGSKGKDGGKKGSEGKGSAEGKGSTKGKGKGAKKGKSAEESYYNDYDAYDSWHSWSGDGQWDSHGWDDWHSDWKASSWKGSW